MAKKINTQPERPLDSVTKPLTKFARDSYNLVHRCTKPTLPEFKKIATVTAVGFLVMGVIGFGIKLIHIPINTILVGSQ